MSRQPEKHHQEEEYSVRSEGEWVTELCAEGEGHVITFDDNNPDCQFLLVNYLAHQTRYRVCSIPNGEYFTYIVFSRAGSLR